MRGREVAGRGGCRARRWDAQRGCPALYLTPLFNLGSTNAIVDCSHDEPQPLPFIAVCLGAGLGKGDGGVESVYQRGGFGVQDRFAGG